MVKLDSRYWVIKSKIEDVKEEMLLDQRGKCPVTGFKIQVGYLDHCHDSGNVRGVLPPLVNTLEGRYRGLFNRMKVEDKFGVPFADFLIGMGNYLKQDFSGNSYHHKHMEDFRKKLDSKYTKETLLKMLEDDYKVKLEPTTLKPEAIQTYMFHWVMEQEKLLRQNLDK
ncbi:hypothetical protein NVP1170O_156 [Vibrio phage 1.170.O._10N.261.52.C3]|nr:hypothetical protein NVP1170O_156 [Vibrio phage 1.170.O._10N.261.52.C3]